MIKQSFQERFKLDDEVMKISRICLVVFFTFIGFGIFAPIDELGLYDPKWIRVLHASVTLSFFIATYFSDRVRNQIQPIMLFFFYTMSIHSLVLLYWNSLYIGYLVGMILVLSCIGVSFVDRRSLVSYLGTVTSAGIVIGIYTKEPQVDLPLYLSSIITPALVSYLTLNIRLSSVEKLRISESKLKGFQDRMLNELELANETQSNLVTTEWPKTKGIRLHSFFRSFDQVGGDAISYLQREDGKLALFFADVSGHGIASAMVSAMAVLAFKIHGNQNEPSVCLRSIHSDLQELVPNNHISACVLFVDTNTKEIQYSIAGHPPLIQIEKETGPKFMEGMGTLIVSFLKPNLKDFTITPNSGDRILLYSDGILEVFDEAGEIYGDEHLFTSIKNHSDKKGEEFLNALYEDSMSFSAKRISDDMSMLLLEIL
ncbi:serine/threonine-protein phosphatase [Leptospira bourretii]|uniref:Serine/threonine-protein phosphatase n=1 Tax=Leptospira bourretii TaxID=2484962 RepID=A0A4V6QLM8_9LEPT|nr:PP2C family protein-serine/threonine phosphatase [Leptospira bourretii]TGK85742.1 serine/threonine-protein phosphatase [Leptospira bourretii]TGK94640.1 serine/threonine-protein phosphatase [Leptospira bourretii]TGL38170.1 serine/threonine-protein phosphatase [Leptospira bourretii]